MMKKFSFTVALLLALLVLSLVFVSCEGAVDPPVTYVVGDIGPAGGLVFYDKGSYSEGWRYLEAASSDVGVESDYEHVFGFYRPPSSSGSPAMVGTETGIGTGQANTTTLVWKMDSPAYSSNSGTSTTAEYAARLCDIHEEGGYDDWFLPSYNELKQMHTNLHKHNPSLGGFVDGEYWSSSEKNASEAWLLVFSTGAQGYTGRANGFRVRPIRAF